MISQYGNHLLLTVAVLIAAYDDTGNDGSCIILGHLDGPVVIHAATGS